MQRLLTSIANVANFFTGGGGGATTIGHTTTVPVIAESSGLRNNKFLPLSDAGIALTTMPPQSSNNMLMGRKTITTTPTKPHRVQQQHEDSLSQFCDASGNVHSQQSLASDARCCLQKTLEEHYAQHALLKPRLLNPKNMERYVPVQPYGQPEYEMRRNYDRRPKPPNELVVASCWKNECELNTWVESRQNQLISGWFWIAAEHPTILNYFKHYDCEYYANAQKALLPPAFPISSLHDARYDMPISIGHHLRIGKWLAYNTTLVRKAQLLVRGRWEPCVMKFSRVFSISGLLKHPTIQHPTADTLFNYLHQVLVQPAKIPHQSHIRYPRQTWCLSQALMECYTYDACAPEHFWGHFFCRDSESPGDLYLVLVLPEFEKTMADWFHDTLDAHDDTGKERHAGTHVHTYIPQGMKTSDLVDFKIQALSQLFTVTLPNLKRRTSLCHLDTKLDNVALIRLPPSQRGLVFQTNASFDASYLNPNDMQQSSIDGMIVTPSNGKRFHVFDYGFAFFVDENGTGWLSQMVQVPEFTTPVQFNNTFTDVVQICVNTLQALVRRWPTAMQKLIADCAGFSPIDLPSPGSIDYRILHPNTTQPIKESYDTFFAASHFAFKVWRPLVNLCVQIIKPTSDKILRFNPCSWETNMYTEASQQFNPKLGWFNMTHYLLNVLKQPFEKLTHRDCRQQTNDFRPATLAVGCESLQEVVVKIPRSLPAATIATTQQDRKRIAHHYDGEELTIEPAMTTLPRYSAYQDPSPSSSSTTTMIIDTIPKITERISHYPPPSPAHVDRWRYPTSPAPTVYYRPE